MAIKSRILERSISILLALEVFALVFISPVPESKSAQTKGKSDAGIYADAGTPDPEIEQLIHLTDQIRDLLSGRLDVMIDAVARGYLEVREERYFVTWTWFRAITRYLQRRHLLVAS